MKERKIIHIEYRAYGAFFPKKESAYYYLAGWSSSIARQTLKWTRRYKVENWRPEREVKKPIVREVQDITCRIFPATGLKRLRDLSPAMLAELRRQKKMHEILIHHSSIHRTSLCFISTIFRKIPIVAQQHGDLPSLMRFRQSKKLSTLLAHLIEKSTLRNIDHFFVLRRSEMEFLSRSLDNPHVTIQTMGVDFDEFKPLDKKSSRKKLGFSEDKKIMLYVGKFYKLKGVDIMLKTFRELKRKYNIELVLIGGSLNDQLYDDVKLSGARFYGYLPHDELGLYYSAADVYLLPAFSKKYAGHDVAAIESLACGTPIVSTTLKDHPSAEWRKLGIIPKDEKDVTRCVADVLENPKSFVDCRKIAKKYYDWKEIMQKTLEVYDMLFEKYYGDKEYPRT